ncbi:proteasome-activating nucleotidase, putative [Babesia caballi]|uniref:Proteasome-activating nucleotidase, putative n=1 Tax=Babesia caballi TaxID=5871 RepID=A0AAV4LRE6_BABCB|nr:proteasome-activating nucleotidase, putative [Babesia caballi]
MRSTWLNLRKAVNEINNFTHLLYSESDEEATARATQPENGQHFNEESRLVVDQHSPGTATSDVHRGNNHNALETAEQRMRMINSLGERGGGTLGSTEPAASSGVSKTTRPISFNEFDFSREGSVNVTANEAVDTASSVAISCRLYILYKLCCNLETLWGEIEDRVRESTGSSMFVPPMRRPQAWQRCQSVHNDHTEKLLGWLERSLHTMGLLSRVVGIEHARVLEGTSLLESVSESESVTASAGRPPESEVAYEPKEENSGEYMRLIRYIAKIQDDHNRRVEKLQATQDAALLKATKATELEKQVSCVGKVVQKRQVEQLKEQNAQLEAQLAEQRKEIKYLTDSLLNANTVKTQLIQKNEQLIASNQRLLMTKSEFIDKDTVSKMIQQYYEQDRTGGQRREDIIKLLESMLGIEPPAQLQEKPARPDVRTLANQFIDFLEERAQ